MSASSDIAAKDSPQLAPDSQTSPPGSTVEWLGRAVPPLLVFVALGGLLAWGHYTGWTLPKFSSLASSADNKKDDWCSEHNVPESICIECRPDLMPRPKVFGWCKTHGVHECPLCHSEVAEMKPRPKISSDDLSRAKLALEFAERPENNSKCKLHERRIQFVSKEAVEKAGIEVEPVWTASMIEAVIGNGEISYDQTRIARLSARTPGAVFQVYKQLGDSVRKGEVLALVDAAEVGRAKSEFLQALAQVRLKSKNLERMSSFERSGAVPERSLREAETAASEAQIRLNAAQQSLTNLGLPIQADSLKGIPDDQLAQRIQFLGLPETITKGFDPRLTTATLLPVFAPFDGTVVVRETVAGEVVDSSKVLFVVVDVRQMWLTLDLRIEDTERIAIGQEVHFRRDGDKMSKGKIVWISTEADRKTRTVKIRATVDNGDGRLRANTFVTGRVILREERKAIVVPNVAVHWEGCCHVVFVRDKNFLKEDSPKVFHVRTVRLGGKDQNHAEIVAGVLPGEVVATKGSAVLRAELLRGNLGEG